MFWQSQTGLEHELDKKSLIICFPVLVSNSVMLQLTLILSKQHFKEATAFNPCKSMSY